MSEIQLQQVHFLQVILSPIYHSLAEKMILKVLFRFKKHFIYAVTSQFPPSSEYNMKKASAESQNVII